MLQQDEPEDFVIATGKAHSVRDCVNFAFDHVGLDPADYVKTDEALMRPAEVDHLIGDSGKAKRLLGWEPRTSFDELISSWSTRTSSCCGATEACSHAKLSRGKEVPVGLVRPAVSRQLR